MARRRRRARRRFGAFGGGSKLPLVLGLAAVLALFGASQASASQSAAIFPAPPRGARVLNRSAAYGVHPELKKFLDVWEERGPFDVEIGQIAGYPGGGLRTAADAAGQAAACAVNLSNACDLASTPHGRGGALDLWPVGFGFNPGMSWEQWTPEIKQAFQDIGEFAEAYGLTWGGRWRSDKMPHGDQPHVELKYWRSLPFPPPDYG